MCQAAFTSQNILLPTPLFNGVLSYTFYYWVRYLITFKQIRISLVRPACNLLEAGEFCVSFVWDFAEYRVPYQCCGSGLASCWAVFRVLMVTMWYGSAFVDPYYWVKDPDQDPALFFVALRCQKISLLFTSIDTIHLHQSSRVTKLLLIRYGSVVTKVLKSSFYYKFFLVDGRTRIRIRTINYGSGIRNRIRIKV